MPIDFTKYLPWRVRTKIDAYRKRLLVSSYQLPIIPLETVVSDVRPVMPLYSDDICMPPHYGPKDHDDFTPLIRIAQRVSPQVIIELGTAHGSTVANLCWACPEAHIFTVNAPSSEQSGDLVTFSLSGEEIGRSYRKHGYENRVTQILANTLHLDLGGYLAQARADLAIIDACHDTEYVRNDFYKIIPFMRSGGVVLFHDTHPSMEGHLEGSYMACMLLRKAGFDIRQVSGCWWGIWVNGNVDAPRNGSHV
jgi:hypothetical protein